MNLTLSVPHHQQKRAVWSLAYSVLGVGACGAFGHRLCEPCLPLGH